jgi:hypothetical protein
LTVRRGATDASGTSHSLDRFSFQGLKGVGLATGTVYRVVRFGTTVTRVSSSNESEVGVSQAQIRFVSTGSEDDFVLRLRLVVVINANGDRVVEDFDSEIRCA